MNKTLAFAAAAALALGAATPALAGWKLVESNQPVAVAKTGMSVRPDAQWNRSPVKPIKTAEIWSLDGASLNELYLVGTLAPGGTLYRDTKKKDAPLPLLKAGMELTDIPQFAQTPPRVALAAPGVPPSSPGRGGGSPGPGRHRGTWWSRTWRGHWPKTSAAATSPPRCLPTSPHPVT